MGQFIHPFLQKRIAPASSALELAEHSRACAFGVAVEFSSPTESVFYAHAPVYGVSRNRKLPLLHFVTTGEGVGALPQFVEEVDMQDFHDTVVVVTKSGNF